MLKDRDATDGLTDIMARAEDASKINRIIERFGLATVDMAQVKNDIEQNHTERQTGAPETPTAELEGGQKQMDGQEVDDLLDAMLSPTSENGTDISEHTDPEQDVDMFLKEVRAAAADRGERDAENPVMGPDREIPSVRAYLKAQRGYRTGCF